MSRRAVDELSGATLVGGELREWSDRPAGLPSDAEQTLLSGLAEAASAVLLVGPRAMTLTGASVVGSHARVTAMGRALDDVRALVKDADRPGAPAVEWIAGAVDRLPDDDGHDLIVVLDGVDTLLGPDSHPMVAADLVAQLAAHLRPGGLLVTLVPNVLGADRLTEVPASPRRSDAAFVQGLLGPDLGRVRASDVSGLALDAGVRVLQTYAVWPTLSSPAVLASPEALDIAEHTVLAAWAARRATETQEPTAHLTDPAALLDDVFAAGQAVTLAPGWLVVLAAPNPTGAPPVGLPLMLVGEPHVSADRRRTLTTWPDGSTAWTVTGDAAVAERTPGLPRPGARLDLLVRRALHVGDRDSARSLLTAWAGWLTSPANAPILQTAVPTNVAVWPAPLTDGPAAIGTHPGRPGARVGSTRYRLDLIDASWPTDPSIAPVAPDTVLRVGVADLAERLVREAARHPFGEGLAAADIATELLVLSGCAADPASPPRTADSQGSGSRPEREAEVTGLRRALEPTGLLVGVQPPSDRAGADAAVRLDRAAVADILERLDSARDALESQRARIRWLEGTLRARDRRVSVLERTVAVESSRIYATLLQVSRPVPAMRRRARSLVDRARGRGKG